MTTVISDLSLRYLVNTPKRGADTDELPLVIVLHGRGADMHDLADLAPLLDPPQGCRFVFANAPRPWEAQPGMTFGWTWFDGWPPEHTSVVRSREVLLQFLGEAIARYPTPDGKVVLAGFSQGAMMSLDAGLRATQPLAGIVAMSGGVYEQDLPSRLAPKPVFIGHGTYDDVVPVAYARRARLVLEEQGFDVTYREYPMAHQVAQEEMEDVRAFLERCLA